MRWGIVTAAVIAVARSLWLSLIVDRTISMHRGRPMRTRTVFSLALSLLPFAGGEAFAAERRVALVIGNSSYIHAPALDNPVNDVTAVSVMLEGAGFQVVETRNNLDNTAMRRVIREFSAMTRDADVAVVFYAGHGLEVDGTNYLIPTDAKLASDIDVEDEAISLDRVLRVLEPARSLRLVILDACRDNPFVKTMKRTLASRSFGRGLARRRAGHVEYPDCLCGQGRVDGERRRGRAQPIHHRAAETSHRARTGPQDRLRQGA